MSTDLILHHYDQSPFSEKVRILFGMKQVAWKSVKIPTIMPKPDLMPLTGGYRRTPVLQIGADVYCDTAIIARELENRFAAPTIYPELRTGMAEAVAHWADHTFFQAAVGVIFGSLADSIPQDFRKDREAMMGRPMNPEAMKAALPVARDQVRAACTWINDHLAGGHRYLMGNQPGLADAAVYHIIWFLRNSAPGETGRLLDPHAELCSWEKRIAAIGHGQSEEISSTEALSIAKEATPSSQEALDPFDPASRKPGDNVSIMPDDYGKDKVSGQLVSSSAHHVAIVREDEQIGKVVNHFPRAGYVIV